MRRKARPFSRVKWLAVPLVGSAVGFSSTANGKDDPVKFGVGLIGVAGGNFLDKPNRSSVDPNIYPGYAGGTFGGGLMWDLRILRELLALEVDVIRSSDKGHGDVTFSGIFGSQSYTHTIGQGAWHVPVLAKLTINIPLIAPQFSIGPELVFPSSPESTLEPPAPGLTVIATAATYVAYTAALGAEIKLPLSNIDLRIPIGVRFSYDPRVPSNFTERVSQPSATTLVYRSEWKYALVGTLGVGIYF